METLTRRFKYYIANESQSKISLIFSLLISNNRPEQAMWVGQPQWRLQIAYFFQPTVQNQKTFAIINDEEKQRILTTKKLEPANVWLFCNESIINQLNILHYYLSWSRQQQLLRSQVTISPYYFIFFMKLAPNIRSKYIDFDSSAFYKSHLTSPAFAEIPCCVQTPKLNKLWASGSDGLLCYVV